MIFFSVAARPTLDLSCIKDVNNVDVLTTAMLVTTPCFKDGVSVMRENGGGANDNELLGFIGSATSCLNDETF